MTTARHGGAAAVLPGTPREWLVATGRISGLMLVLLGCEMAGDALPEPLGRPATRAWGRLARALRDMPPGYALPAADRLWSAAG